MVLQTTNLILRGSLFSFSDDLAGIEGFSVLRDFDSRSKRLSLERLRPPVWLELSDFVKLWLDLSSFCLEEVCPDLVDLVFYKDGIFGAESHIFESWDTSTTADSKGAKLFVEDLISTKLWEILTLLALWDTL